MQFTIGKSNQEKLLVDRITGLQEIVDLLKCFTPFSVPPIATGLNGYQISLQHLRENGLDYALKYRQEMQHFIHPIFVRDIIAILQTGEGLCPSIWDLPRFIAAEDARKIQERTRAEHEQSQRRKAAKQQIIDAEKRARREKLAAEIGVDLSQLTGAG